MSLWKYCYVSQADTYTIYVFMTDVSIFGCKSLIDTDTQDEAFASQHIHS